ncbi:hypothetical protein RMATCC62417_11570 [Rhizopus microsporus]|nr:hypothetical protein RMATCC62417_11570 [Rhizopus microsporus]
MRDQIRSILKAMYERKKQTENEKHRTSFKGKAKRKMMSQAEKIENKKEKKKAKYDRNDEQEKTLFVQVATKRDTRMQDLPYTQIES